MSEADLDNPILDTPTNDFRRGFVYERVQHITLKSIADNLDIVDGMSREEIDRAIKRHADFELLYDKPYELETIGPYAGTAIQALGIRPTTDDEAGATPSRIGITLGPQYRTVNGHLIKTAAREAIPHKKLERDLKTEIDENAVASLNRTESRPFPPPSTGKIAVKVINDYGDEVLRVFEPGDVP